MTRPIFDRDCRRCPRLAGFLDEVREKHSDYYCRPVPPFGDLKARFLIVGLAPGLHGANRTGRPFTGDHAGIMLYQMLHRYGFSSHEASTSADDALELTDCRITNAVKCLPPQNKPVGAEINTCNDFLAAELDTLADDAVVLALGGIAHRAIVRARGLHALARVQSRPSGQPRPSPSRGKTLETNARVRQASLRVGDAML